jgi:hypothetical protein
MEPLEPIAAHYSRRCENEWRSYENAFLSYANFALPRRLPANNAFQ